MAEGMRLICPVCKKVNPSTRKRCMYCEKDMTGATLATDEVPDYLKGKRRAFPWRMVLLFLIAAAAAGGYFFWYVPHQRGAMVVDVELETFNAETIEVRSGGGKVTIAVRWEKGSKTLAIERGDKVVEKLEGNPPKIDLVKKLEPGTYRVVVEGPEPGGRMKVWLK
jgi:hypothetical protein